MEFKTVFKRSKKFYALFALLLIFAITPLALSGCGGGGGGSSSGSSLTPNSNGGYNLSQNYTITGTVTGGSGPIPSGTVTLYVPNSTDTGFVPTGYTAQINNGSYTISNYPGTGSQDFLVMVTTPSDNTMYNIGYSAFGTPNVTININELTTAQTVDSFIQSGGNVTASSPGSLPLGSISSAGLTNWYNDIPSTLGVQSFQTASVSSSLSANEIESVATALASCVQQTSYCSSITRVIPSYSPGTGTFVYNLILNINNSSVLSAMSSLLSYASSNPLNLNLPWTVPATLILTGSSGETTTTSSSGETTNVFSYNELIYPLAIAIDGSGNVWVANYGDGIPGTAFGDSNVTELSPNGSIIGTYTAGNGPDAIAIDGSGNVWVANYAGGNVTELTASSNYTTSNTYTVGSSPVAIAIDGSGNVWVANEGNGTVGTAFGDSNVTELTASSNYTTSNTYTAGSLPVAIAIDGSGNVWVANYGGGFAGTAPGDANVMELSPTGSLIGTYTVGISPDAIAIDASGNIWVANEGSGTVGTSPSDSNVTELTASSNYTTSNTYTAGSYPQAIATDGSGNIWVANAAGTATAGTASFDSNVMELSPSGSLIGTYTAGSYPKAIAIDGSGNVWVANGVYGTVNELVGAATGVKTPLLDQPK